MVRIYFDEVPRMVKLTEIEGWLTGVGGREVRSYYLIGTEFPFGMVRVLEMDSGDG